VKTDDGAGGGGQRVYVVREAVGVTDVREDRLVVVLGRKQAFETQSRCAKSGDKWEARAAVRWARQ
jgi:hypothetical protein